MKCKDCEQSFLVKSKNCEDILLCLVGEKPEVINMKYYEDEDGCEGI